MTERMQGKGAYTGWSCTKPATGSSRNEPIAP